MQRCKKCGLPKNYKNISFTEDGVCNYCAFYENNKAEVENVALLETKFKRKINEAKEIAENVGSKYDCLVGFSGGKDSTYIIYQLKKVYGMRVLAFTYQNGFMTDYAVKNMRNALEKIGVDHILFSMNSRELQKKYRTSVKLLHNFCGVCFHFVHYYSYLYAAQNKIPLIVNGRTKGQMWQNLLDTKLIEPYNISKTLLEFEYQMFHGLEQKFHKIGKMDYLEEIHIDSLSYFAYHDISEEETMQYLEKEIGWERPKDGASHGDCLAHGMAEYLFIKKTGYPIRLGELAVEVRRGKMSISEMDQIIKKDIEKYSDIGELASKRFYSMIGC